MATLTQLALDQQNIDCGMSYIFQLDDGSFFLIDGGYFTPGESERLFTFLCAHTQGKPIIAGWFFSHAHQDHIGVFIDMMQRHRGDVDLRGIYYNFQPLALPETDDGWNIQSNDLGTIRHWENILEQSLSNIPRRVLHRGDHVAFSGLSLHVLQTHEQVHAKRSFNDCSTVVRIDLSGQRFLFLGDLGRQGAKTLLQHTSYEQMRCDFVQVAHHGFEGANREVYEACAAAYALWPTPDYKLPSILYEYPVNMWLWHSTNENIVSGYGTKTLSLPYKPVRRPVPVRLPYAQIRGEKAGGAYVLRIIAKDEAAKERIMDFLEHTNAIFGMPIVRTSVSLIDKMEIDLGQWGSVRVEWMSTCNVACTFTLWSGTKGEAQLLWRWRQFLGDILNFQDT